MNEEMNALLWFAIPELSHFPPQNDNTNRRLTLGYHNPRFAMMHVIKAFVAMLGKPFEVFLTK